MTYFNLLKTRLWIDVHTAFMHCLIHWGFALVLVPESSSTFVGHLWINFHFVFAWFISCFEENYLAWLNPCFEEILASCIWGKTIVLVSIMFFFQVMEVVGFVPYHVLAVPSVLVRLVQLWLNWFTSLATLWPGYSELLVFCFADASPAYGCVGMCVGVICSVCCDLSQRNTTSDSLNTYSPNSYVSD